MLYFYRYFSFKIISIIFLFFTFANLQSNQIVQTKDVLHDLTTSLGDFKDQHSFSNLEDVSMFLGFLKDIKENLNFEKNKLEEFKDSFWSLCNLLNKSDSFKEEKLKILSANVKELNRLLDSGNSITALDEKLKEKIFLLGDLIRLFINNDGIDLDKLGQDYESVVQAIEAIAQFLNNDAYNKQKSYKEPIINKKKDKVEAMYQDTDYLGNESDNTLINSELTEDNAANVAKEDSGKIFKEELAAFENTAADNITYEDEISDEQLIADQNKNVKKNKTGKIANINMQDVVNSGKATVRALSNISDYCLGGYPVQFVHQLLRHMDKVYNK